MQKLSKFSQKIRKISFGKNDLGKKIWIFENSRKSTEINKKLTDFDEQIGQN